MAFAWQTALLEIVSSHGLTRPFVNAGGFASNTPSGKPPTPSKGVWKEIRVIESTTRISNSRGETSALNLAGIWCPLTGAFSIMNHFAMGNKTDDFHWWYFCELMRVPAQRFVKLMKSLLELVSCYLHRPHLPSPVFPLVKPVFSC
jgi:hypothetical protein